MINREALRIAMASPLYFRFCLIERLEIVNYIKSNMRVRMSPRYIKLRDENDPMPTIEEAFENYLRILNKEDREHAKRFEERESVGVFTVGKCHTDSKE
jgi:hypothetical protein